MLYVSMEIIKFLWQYDPATKRVLHFSLENNLSNRKIIKLNTYLREIRHKTKEQ